MPELLDRETWATPRDFLFACIGFSVGLGNVWRFPYLCYKHGGGAFLIPYLICVLVGAVPMFYLEVALGQFMGAAGVKAWNLVPIFRGIGISTLIIVFFLNCYYNVILAWAFFYFFASFTSELPWTNCDREDWATEHCFKFDSEPEDNRCNWNGTSTIGAFIKNINYTLPGMNDTFQAGSNGTCIAPEVAKLNGISIFVEPVDPTTEYWERRVLRLSDGIGEMGPARWDLSLCLLLAWIVVYVCIVKGIRYFGKVVYVTATAPYLFMVILLIRNSVLDGAGEGVAFYLKPDFGRMGDVKVWVDAGTQIFFSYSISLGVLTALSSYNRFRHNSFRDSIIFAIVNSGTSFFAGFIIFTVLGHMAHVQRKDIEDVAVQGPGLAFVAYPKAVSLMPGAPVWSAFFFLMVIFLGMDSQFVGVEGIITAIVDQWPNFLRRGHRREIFIAIVCFVHFLIGLPMVTDGGFYVFAIFNHYTGSRVILLVGFFTCIAISWVYGINRFYDNVEMMLGSRLSKYYMWVCWLAITPLFCIVFFLMDAATEPEVTIESSSGIYEFPSWAVAIGWLMSVFAFIWIPIGVIYHLIKYVYLAEHGSMRENLKLCLQPVGLQPHQLRPKDKESLGHHAYPGSGTGNAYVVPPSSDAVDGGYSVHDNKGFDDGKPFPPAVSTASSVYSIRDTKL